MSGVPRLVDSVFDLFGLLQLPPELTVKKSLSDGSSKL